MSIETQHIEYYDNGTLLEGFLAFDSILTGPLPGVMIAHPWAGRNQAMCDKAIELAELGYVGFALDMYGKGVLGTSTEQNSALMQPFVDNRGLVQARMITAFETFRQLTMVDSKCIAALGYCFGGLCVLDLARSSIQLKGVISVHGLLKAPDDIEYEHPIRASILVQHGYLDPLAPADELIALQQEFNERQADWQVQIHGQAMHAFSNPSANDIDFGTVYHQITDQRSWISITNFLSEVLM
ncbi:MAG: dienelactone hydrolase family protein [Gammaproteobacteria bacterium]|nr:dienelactone hydrolase family protein [Gammaproteobacteria bacterium]